jgi:hypothetical protein
MIEHVDARRIAVASVLPIWDSFRRRHDDLDGCPKYRRRRYLIWRAAAMTMLLERGAYQDEADAAMIRAKLVDTYADGIGPLDAAGSYDGYNLWNPTAPGDDLENYAADVLALFRVAITDGTIQ